MYYIYHVLVDTYMLEWIGFQEIFHDMVCWVEAASLILKYRMSFSVLMLESSIF